MNRWRSHGHSIDHVTFPNCSATLEPERAYIKEEMNNEWLDSEPVEYKLRSAGQRYI